VTSKNLSNHNPRYQRLIAVNVQVMNTPSTRNVRAKSAVGMGKLLIYATALPFH